MTPHGPRLLPLQNFAMDSSNHDDSTAGFRGFLPTILRGKWIITAFTALTLLLTMYFIFGVSVSKYRATAVVMLKTQRDSVIDLQGVVSGLSGERSSVNSEVEVLRARGLMTEVVDRLNLLSDPEFNTTLSKPDLKSLLRATLETAFSRSGSKPTTSTPVDQVKRRQDVAVNTLLTNVIVRNIPQSLVFEITVETTDPAKSALIADTIVDLYILNQIRVKFEATEQATNWLANRVAELQVQLEDAESRLASFSASTDLISVESLQGLERQLKDLRGRVVDSRGMGAALGTRLGALKNAKTWEQKAIAAGDAALNRMKVGAETSTVVASEFNDRFDRILLRAGLEAQRSKLQVGSLQASKAQLERQISQQGGDLITLQQFTRDAEANRILYEYFLGRLKETSAQQGIQQADSRVLSNAVAPTRASSPRKSLLMSLAALFGLVLGTGFVLYKETQNVCFRTAQDLEEYTGLPVLGQVPTIPGKNRRQLLSLFLDQPASAGAEAVRNLRTSTLLSNVDKPPQVIVLTSPMPGEGKTTVSLAFAHTLSGMGKKVLMIEGDVRRRMLHHYFDDLPCSGLISVLSGTRSLEDAICRIPGFAADILMVERTATNAADLFSSCKFRDMIAELRTQYDVIVIDTPPVLAVPDARIIAQQADVVLLNVKWNSTSKSQVDEALRLFRCGSRKISGLVLNQICIKAMKHYGYGGRYGTYDSEYLAA